MPQTPRRQFLTRITGALGLGFLGKAATALTTPSAAEGPFYPTPRMRTPDIDNDLVKIAGMVKEAGGEVIMLSGRIMDQKGEPRANHRIEIWQCDVNGRYMHPGDRNSARHDTGFQGFGHDITDADGAYVFRTIKPASYPGRTPHIHVKVFDPSGRELLTTQFYEAGNRGNAKDRLFNRMSKEAADSVSMRYSADNQTTVDITV